MNSEAGQEDEQAETAQMIQAPPGNLAIKCCCWCLLFLGVFLVLLVIAVSFIPYYRKSPCEQCPSEWIGYKRKCYFISEKEENWTSSQTFCARNESLLAVFENQEEMHSLAKHLKIDDFWIGLRKKGESFFWENGVAFKVDSFQMRNHSECAYLDAFIISTSACSLPRHWICFQFSK
ncbi:PREDICTED: C-type lectin domain family 2 member L-like [Calidris pugnax]|uniref:C-type lectin domain family 2 member L-like n=1 Tax=Calidris pugnax TaxID=198806 RepID=UPI00071DD35B|nr:PREDICTED: C-type lectin domain family 2 member L-like [Calidris pugnax]XP_014795655.1 PREDICTED: C-type lectin domain family 2 member L-like [Calidris pugnax]XP_014795656.1 PREDICTED: C-type lectin domain family 2 member L-like [Calidris pugnax]XP_014795657.1 PREDICTED: C-type lectin domain family 2 member L-like [Calidris pugnax]XP_014795658.1 PREDICTED: C-type lectin domain family 2 member L-like [Calidris pugnax]